MKRNLIPAAIMMTLIISSCSYPHFYNTPIAQNVPLNDTSNEFTGLVAGSFGAVNQSFEAQASYSFPMNIALAGSFLTGGNSHNPDDLEDYSKVNYIEGALGCYKSFSKICSFEIFAGYGQGKQKHVYAYDLYQGGLVWTWVRDGESNISFSQVFLQPDFGVKYKWIEAAISCRLSRLNYADVMYSGTTYRVNELQALRANSKVTLLEPGFTLRAGSPVVKTQLQIVLSANMTDQNLLNEVFRINFGLHFTFGGSLSKNQKTVSSSEPPLAYR
jgi:hypothetical protein